MKCVCMSKTEQMAGFTLRQQQLAYPMQLTGRGGSVAADDAVRVAG
jgi:hypothetical protein